MAIITTTAQVNDKNTKTINTVKGEKKIISIPIFQLEKGAGVKNIYASAFIPDFIQFGDVVTVSGRIEVKKSGDFTNYNFLFPTVEKVFVYNTSSANTDISQAEIDDLFGETSVLDSDDEDGLPF